MDVMHQVGVKVFTPRHSIDVKMHSIGQIPSEWLFVHMIIHLNLHHTQPPYQSVVLAGIMGLSNDIVSTCVIEWGKEHRSTWCTPDPQTDDIDGY